jgi:hypothetical protein
MARRRALTTAATLAVAVASATVPALGAGGFSTAFISLSWTDNDNGTDFFDGDLEADPSECEKGRRVRLYRKEPGNDPRVGSAKTKNSGKFSIEREDPGSGKYLAKVKKKRIGELLCVKAKAGPLQITDLSGV